jgi:hypothetical protein
LVLTADANELTFKVGCSLILPYARAVSALHLEAPVQLAFSQDADVMLVEDDLVEGDGHFHLIAGKRVTELGKDRIRAGLQSLKSFMLMQLPRPTGGKGETPRPAPDVKLLHPMLREWTKAAAIPHW